MNPAIRYALLTALALQPLMVTAYTTTLTTTPATNALPDLDRDGIPNIADPDVDNDGVLNGADRNIDGGVAIKGPLRGRSIGDQLPNNAAAELDMDADGLADNAPNETDIDGDGLADSASTETDMDGDGLADNASAETDIDGDGLADNAATETDIDGDGIGDGNKAEVDIDGDGVANGADPDVDGDGLANLTDPDFDGSGEVDDFLGDTAGNAAAYVDDATVQPVIDLVSAEIRRQLNIAGNDPGLRVRVQPSSLPGLQSGVWRYLSADNMQVWAKWAYATEQPSAIKIFVNYEYTGPYAGRSEDYVNPSNYRISAESRFYAQYPRGSFTFHSWLPGEPVGFYYSAPNEQATGRPVPTAALNTALAAYPNFYSDGNAFAGDLAPSLSSLQPVLDLQRLLFKATRSANARFEAAQIAAESAAASRPN